MNAILNVIKPKMYLNFMNPCYITFTRQQRILELKTNSITCSILNICNIKSKKKISKNCKLSLNRYESFISLFHAVLSDEFLCYPRTSVIGTTSGHRKWWFHSNKTKFNHQISENRSKLWKHVLNTKIRIHHIPLISHKPTTTFSSILIFC